MPRIQKATKTRSGTAHKRETKGTDHDYSIFEFSSERDSAQDTTPETTPTAIKWPSRAVTSRCHSRSRKRRHTKYKWSSDSASPSSSNNSSSDEGNAKPQAKKAKNASEGVPMEWLSLERLFAGNEGKPIDRGTLKKHRALVEKHRVQFKEPRAGDAFCQDGPLGAKGYGWRQRFFEDGNEPLCLTYSQADSESESILIWEAAVMGHINSHSKRSNKKGHRRGGVPLVGAAFRADSMYELSVDVGGGCVVVGSLQQFFEHHCHTSQSPVPEPVAATISLSILQTLGQIHKHGVSHNDLGLDSFLITRSVSDGKGRFGLALVGFGTGSRVIEPTSTGSPTDDGNPCAFDLVAAARLIWLIITGHHRFDVKGASGKRLLPWSLESCVSLRAAAAWEELLLQLLNPPSAGHGLHLVRDGWDRLDSARKELEAVASGLDWASEFHGAAGTAKERLYDFPTKLTAGLAMPGDDVIAAPASRAKTAETANNEEEIQSQVNAPREPLKIEESNKSEADSLPEPREKASMIDRLQEEVKALKEALKRAEDEKIDLLGRHKKLESEASELRVRSDREAAAIEQLKARKKEDESALERAHKETAGEKRRVEREQQQVTQELRRKLEESDRTVRNVKSQNAKEMDALKKAHVSAMETIRTELEDTKSKLEEAEKDVLSAKADRSEKNAGRIRRLEAANEGLTKQASKLRLELEKQQRKGEQDKKISRAAERKNADLAAELAKLRDVVSEGRPRLESEIRRLQAELETANGENKRWHKAERKLHYRTLNLQVRESQFRKALLKVKD